MARAVTTNAPVTLAPTNDIYTALLGIGFLVGVVGLGVLIIRAGSLGVELFKF
jgi:hypothetical protein